MGSIKSDFFDAIQGEKDSQEILVHDVEIQYS